MIEFINVSKFYADDVAAVYKLNFSIEKGELLVLLGPSGCGKTTTLKMVNRLVEPSEGNILIDGVDNRKYDVIELRRNIGYVIQEVGLFPHMTIGENIGIVPHLKGWSKSKIENRVAELLYMVELDPQTFFERRPDELSGGQRQRVGIARALAADPEILLMDEPFGAIDPITRETLQTELVKLHERLKKTIIFVTHDIFEAFRMGTRIAIMKDGEIVQIASPKEIVENPKEFVADFLGRHRKFLLEETKAKAFIP